MRVVDTNFILRYLLEDIIEQYKDAEKIFSNNKDIFIPGEIIAEVVYVMMGVYKVSKEDIRDSILALIQIHPYPTTKVMGYKNPLLRSAFFFLH